MTSATPRVMSPPPDLGGPKGTLDIESANFPQASTLRTGGKRENKNEPVRTQNTSLTSSGTQLPAKRTANASKVKKPTAITGVKYYIKF